MTHINTFWKIVNKIGIEIPPIQRDYAQGRPTEKASKVRKSFLGSIENALESENKLSLDFIYGKIFGLKNQEEHQRNISSIQALLNSVKDYALTVNLRVGDISIEDKSTDNADIVYLIPLDGQQRLTTLFLIHWYIAKRLDDVNAFVVLSRFRYKTRKSSTAFLKLLTNIDTKISFEKEQENESLAEGSFYKGIRDLEYFSLVWLNDPTVQSMMNMLQAIHYKFQYKTRDVLERYWALLTTSDLLYFSFLNLHDFNLSDDLYVKINARGKELTTFENFKAWIFGAVEEDQLISAQVWEEYRFKFDIEWNDIFWKNKSENNYNVDDAYFNYFKKRYLVDLTINAPLQQSSFGLERDKWISEDILSLKTDFDFEKNFSNLFKNRLNGYLDTLDAFSTKSIPDSKIALEIAACKDFWFNGIEKFTWIDLIKNYSFISFFEYNAEKLDDPAFDFFTDYYRVVSNLINNQTFDNTQLYQNVFRDITIINRYMKYAKTNVYAWLDKVDENNKAVFTKDQLEEEKLKWRLIQHDFSWMPILVEAERHPLFVGKIGFLLRLSENRKDLFLDYFNKISPLFQPALLAHSEKILQRSLLTFGNYFEQKNGETYYFYKNDLTTYRARRENWLGFLNNQLRDGILCKMIFDEQYDNHEPIQSLKEMINSFIQKHPVEMLKEKPLVELEFFHLYIYCHQLFDYGESNLIRLENDNYAYQLNKSNTGGYFNDAILDFIKFNHFKADDLVLNHRTKGWGNRPSLEINGERIMVAPYSNRILVENIGDYEPTLYFYTISDAVTYIKQKLSCRP